MSGFILAELDAHALVGPWLLNVSCGPVVQLACEMAPAVKTPVASEGSRMLLEAVLYSKSCAAEYISISTLSETLRLILIAAR